MIYRKWILSILLLPAGLSGFAQNNSPRPDIARIYEDGDRFYRDGNYTTALDYLRRESGEWINRSDTILYLKIKCLDKIYMQDSVQTRDLESTLQRFFSRVNKNTFPEFRYGEVTSIYSRFQTFKEKDRAFYDSVSRAFDLNKTEALNPLLQVTTAYLNANPNTYYYPGLSGYIKSIKDQLAHLETVRKKKERDSIFRSVLKSVGRTPVLNLSYSVPSGGKEVFKGVDNAGEMMGFLEGTYSGTLAEKYSVGASFTEAFINIYTGTRAKVGINWNIFDAELTAFDWSLNSYVTKSSGNGEIVDELRSVKAGTRIGPVLAVLLSKKIAGAVYYSARPGIQFLLGKYYFSQSGITGTTTYEIKPVYTNFNFSNEVGLKVYFFKRFFINPFLHFGTYNWQNDIIETQSGTATQTTRRVKADYPFKNMGVRIGF